MELESHENRLRLPGAGKNRDILRMRAIPERIRGVLTARHYTNPRLRYLTLPYLNEYEEHSLTLGKH